MAKLHLWQYVLGPMDGTITHPPSEAWDILRTRGVPLGKRDYEGRLRARSA